MVMEMEKPEKEPHRILLDVVEVGVVVEMNRTRRIGLGPGSAVQVMTDNVREELEKEPGTWKLCCDLMMTVLRIVRDSSIALSDWGTFAGSWTAL